MKIKFTLITNTEGSLIKIPSLNIDGQVKKESDIYLSKVTTLIQIIKEIK